MAPAPQQQAGQRLEGERQQGVGKSQGDKPGATARRIAEGAEQRLWHSAALSYLGAFLGIPGLKILPGGAGLATTLGQIEDGDKLEHAKGDAAGAWHAAALAYFGAYMGVAGLKVLPGNAGLAVTREQISDANHKADLAAAIK